MPSSLVVPVATVDTILPHANADALEIAHILGWQVVVRKGEYQAGEKVVYFPPDTVLPVEVSDRFGVTKYLSKGRIRCAKLRGEPSFGLAVRPDDSSWPIGEDVADRYGATKYEPPVRVSAGDADTPHPLFVEYTSIENLRNFPTVLQEGEPVVVSEKIHGTNCRVGIIEGEFMAGSHAVRRKDPGEEARAANTYWFPLTKHGVAELLADLQAHGQRSVILFGEVYGSKIQSLHYGEKNGAIGFRAFDLMVDGKYLDHVNFLSLCEDYGIETVPYLGAFPFSLDAVKNVSGGKTTLIEGDGHIREGVVVKPLTERTDPKIGRVVLKYLSDEYLFAKESDSKDV